MMGPKLYVRWINGNIGFNPRGARNSNAMSEYVMHDLRNTSITAINVLTNSKDLIPIKNANVPIGEARLTVRNIDLVLSEKGEPGSPLSVQLSVENKTIMAAHGKARKNRYGDIVAYCGHMHNHRRDCVVGATVVINTSAVYQNPDSFAASLVRPNFDMGKVVAKTIKVFENIPLRDLPSDPVELPEALAVILVNYDGINPASLVEGTPDGSSPSNYDNFIKRLVRIYEDRFCQ